tara:strand:- start:873 stop:1430 length:558 start_codon:yes stop_codon:yes gene_type:complete
MKLSRKVLRNLIIQEIEKIGEDSLIPKSHVKAAFLQPHNDPYSGQTCYECGAEMHEGESSCMECGAMHEKVINEGDCGCGSTPKADDFDYSSLGDFSDLEGTNITHDNAFLAGLSVSDIHNDHHDGAYMAKSQLYKVSKYAKELYHMIPEGYNLDDWMRTKLAQISDDISEVYHALDHDKKQGNI